jgi:hypothetical protein
MTQPKSEQERQSLIERTLYVAAEIERVNPAQAALLLSQALTWEAQGKEEKR